MQLIDQETDGQVRNSGAVGGRGIGPISLALSPRRAPIFLGSREHWSGQVWGGWFGKEN